MGTEGKRLPLMSAVMLELGQKPALVLRRFADGTLQADVRGDRMWAVIKELGI